MIYIAHRGNTEGKNEVRENSPYYIMEALAMGFDVEIDLRYIDGNWWLGHDEPQYEIDFNWIEDRSQNLWVHCKNKEAVEYFIENDFKTADINWFWHEEDTMTLTSFGYVWVYPGKQPIKGSIAVMPEIHNDNVRECGGICSDYIKRYKDEIEQTK